METLRNLLELLGTVDEHLNQLVARYGAWVYGILFTTIFAETGLVITPFLPGDTLLFACGMLAHPTKGSLSLPILIIILPIAAFCGDNVNYWFGRFLGKKLFRNPRAKVFKPKYVQKTQEFFDKHGGRAVILARWVPIVRTFAPFVAGMGSMPYRKFLTYSLIGAIIWVWGCVGAGFVFGKIKWVADNFGMSMIILVVASLIPMVIHAVVGRIKARKEPVTGHPKPHRPLDESEEESGGVERIRTAE